MDRDHLYALWTQAQEQPIAGWDFSRLDGRMESGALPWDYRAIVLSRLRPDSRLLDMGTGGGEFLLGLGHPRRERLSPLGIEVKDVREDNRLDFPGESFDLIINRHEDLSAPEIFRCLKPGGMFITQQVGGGNNHDLAKRLIPGCAPSFPDHTLSANVRLLEAAGFEVIRREEAFPRVRFYDIAALVYFAGIIEWEFPGFSIDTSFEQLISLQGEIETTGHIDGTEHRFLIAAAKK